MQYILRVAVFVLVGAALGYVTYLELASQRDHRALVIVCAAVIGFGGVLDPLLQATANEFGQISFAKRLHLEEPIKALIVAIEALNTGLTVHDVGVTAFLVRRTHRHPIRGVQLRVFRFRLQAIPRPTQVQWTMRKGVLGECWQHLAIRGLAHRSAYAQYVRYTRRQWRNVDQSIRRHLSLRDMRAVAGFGYVEAHPVISENGDYKGCIVVQVEESQGTLVQRPEIQNLIEIAAANVAASIA